MVRIENAYKTFPARFWTRQPAVEVLRGFDMEASPGKVTGLLGRNGAGKTTLFRLMTGLEILDAGRITIDGLDPQRDRALARGRIALLPENPGVFGAMSGRDHLRQFGTMMGLSLAAIDRRLALIDDELKFSTYWERHARGYSKGQRMRIALARMRLSEEAAVFIFDEPTNGLDFEAASAVRQFIRGIARQGNVVIISSHILGDIQLLCDQMVGLEDGKTCSPEVVSGWMQEHLRSVTPTEETA